MSFIYGHIATTKPIINSLKLFGSLLSQPLSLLEDGFLNGCDLVFARLLDNLPYYLIVFISFLDNYLARLCFLLECVIICNGWWHLFFDFLFLFVKLL